MAARRLPAVSRRLSSSSATSTFTAKAVPSKAHLHQPIPDASFPQGYALAGVHCGVKKDPSVLDLAVLLSTSPRPTSTAACFTRNAFKAAPVTVSQEVLTGSAGRARALVANSGCANAVTGKQGLNDAWAMVRATDALLAPPPPPGANATLVMSTGVIGQTLPIANILAGIHALSPSTPPSPSAPSVTLGAGFLAWERFARAFMTTDTFPKLRARTFALGGRTYRLAGVDKGAGMIHPNMAPHATLLGCIATDAAVSPRSLQSALAHAVDRSFNSISVDGDMSTNDTIVAFANGAAAGGEGAAVEEIDEERDRAGYEAFRDELTSFAQDLAQLVVRDGEGATKFVTVSVDVRCCFTSPGCFKLPLV